MSEDHCVICMDPLEWTGFGACGHKEVRPAAWQRRQAHPLAVQGTAAPRPQHDRWPAKSARGRIHPPSPLPPPLAQACSRCVARLRFVLDDKRCMYCHQQLDEVFFTRYMGDFTARPGEFSKLRVSSAGALGRGFIPMAGLSPGVSAAHPPSWHQVQFERGEPDTTRVCR